MVRIRNTKKDATAFFSVIFIATQFFIATVVHSEQADGKSTQNSISAEQHEYVVAEAGTETNTTAKQNDQKSSSAIDGAKEPLQQPTGAEPVENPDIEIAAFEAECMGATQKNRFVLQNQKYLNQWYRDISMYVLDCNALQSGNDATCNINSGSENEKQGSSTDGDLSDIEQKCKTNFRYYTYLMKASREPENCIDSAMKFCDKSVFCPDPPNCTCDSTAYLICAFSKIHSSDECLKLSETASTDLKEEVQKKDVFSFCNDVLTGYQSNPSNIPQGKDAKYTNLIFLIGVLGGKDWPLFSKNVDLEKLYIDPENIWYYKNVYIKKSPCDAQLGLSWNFICKEYAIKKHIAKQSKKPDEGVPQDTDKNMQQNTQP